MAPEGDHLMRCRICTATVTEDEREAHVAECHEPALEERRCIQEYEKEQERRWREENER